MFELKRREKRVLLLLREYTLGGAETQFRYLIEYAVQHQWKLDVVIEHDLTGKRRLKGKGASCELEACLKEPGKGTGSVRFFTLDGGRENGRLFRDVMLHIAGSLPRVKYGACLIYYPPDLVFAPFMRLFGIRVIYSERVDAAAVIENPSRRMQLKFCSRVLANSAYAQGRLESLTGRKVGLIRNGKPAVRKSVPIGDRRIRRILVPARIAPPKNQWLALCFLKKHPEFEGKIVFAGMAEDRGYRNKMEWFIRKNNMQGRTEFLGNVDDMAAEYEKADLVMLPSFSEGTPNVVLEAFAYGRPVIVSDIGPERDIVADPKLRFGVKDPEGIAWCIAYVEGMADHDYRQMLERNRVYVLRHYSIGEMAERFYAALTVW